MAELVAKHPLEGVNLHHGRARACAMEWDHITAIMPYRGQEGALAKAFAKAHGFDWPETGCWSGNEKLRAFWSGREQVFLIGSEPASPELTGYGALCGQSDAWAGVVLSGPDARDVMARLCPLDLRQSAFGAGKVARSEIGHMSTLIACTDEDALMLLVMRSMASTLHHELDEAMARVAAR